MKTPLRFIILGTTLSIAMLASGHAAILTGSFTILSNGTNTDLTTLGTLDWAKFGVSGSNNFTSKAGVVNGINNVTTTSPTAIDYPNNFKGTFQWSDGAPVPSGSGNIAAARSYPFAISSPVNLTFTVSSSGGPQTLEFYTALYNTTSTITASLAGVSDFTIDDTNLNITQNSFRKYTLNFASDTPGDLLTVSWSGTTGTANPNGNIELAAATLVPEPSTIVMLMGVMGGFLATLALLRRRRA